LEQQNKEALSHDTFMGFESFVNELKDTMLPGGYLTICKEKEIYFHFMHCPDIDTIAPQLLISVVVPENLAFHAFAKSVLLPPDIFKDLSSGSLNKMSELTNILALCKWCFCESSSYNSSSKLHVDFAVASLSLHRDSYLFADLAISVRI